jgi:uracil-DNA glycosylase family 4
MSDTHQFIDDIIQFVEEKRDHGENRIYLAPEVRNALFSEDNQRSAPSTAPTAHADTAKTVTEKLVPSAPPPPPTPKTAPPVKTEPPGLLVAETVQGDSLDEIQAIVAKCSKCPLHTGRTNTVFGEGNPNADLMFIGEGPGADEDRTGRPFVGRAGQLLTKMIAAMQFAREDVYIANIIKCRPPGNRNPEDEEAIACLPYLKRQIELIQPKCIVLLGGVALQHLLGIKGIMTNRGKWQSYMDIPTLPTYHPSFLLRSPNRKKEVWQDLQDVMRKLGKQPGKAK